MKPALALYSTLILLSKPSKNKRTLMGGQLWVFRGVCCSKHVDLTQFFTTSIRHSSLDLHPLLEMLMAYLFHSYGVVNLPSHPYSSTLMQMATFQSTGRNLRNLTDTCLYRDTSFTVVPSELPSRVCKIFHMAHTYMVIHTYSRMHIYIYSQKLVLTQ